MKYTLILLFFVITNSLGLGTFKNGLLIDQNTNQPYTGTLEILNNDWGNDSIEFSRQYYKGIINGIEKSYYKSGVLKSVGKFNEGLLDGDVTGYYENGSVRVVGHFYDGVKDGNFMIADINGVVEYLKYKDGILTDISKYGKMIQIQ